MTTPSSLWTSYPFDEKREIRIDLEDLRVRIARRGSDLLLMERRCAEEDDEAGASFPETDFRRHAFEYPVDSVAVAPRTPERALVVQPAHPLLLAPKARVDFFVSVPVDLQLSAVTGKKEEP
ncbi:MAG TPA: hypothetical protein VJ952_12575, partial [Opitutales bacterium]|nr:hypothetical protein [Opitutales bacterium]